MYRVFACISDERKISYFDLPVVVVVVGLHVFVWESFLFHLFTFASTTKQKQIELNRDNLSLFQFYRQRITR